MLQSADRETEILLGNKQLLGVFFVIAALLGLSFVGGYKVGQSGSKPAIKSPAPAVADPVASARSSGGVGETHRVGADETVASTPDTEASVPSPAHHPKVAAKIVAPPEAPTRPAIKSDGFVPEPGQQFLQVAAVQKNDADAVANALRKKGFRAHAVPKPGSSELYRVIVGPLRDAGELSSTRDSLRKTGFQQVIVQRYQP